MDLGGDIDNGTLIAESMLAALDMLDTDFSHLLKLVKDGTVADPAAVVQVMQRVEQSRNRFPLLDHALIDLAKQHDLPTVLCQGSMRRVLTSTLLISKGEAARRVRAAAAVGPRTSPLGEALTALRPHLAAAQQAGTISADHVDIIERALGPLDRAGYDPDDLDTGEQLLTRHAETFGPEDLRHLAARVADAINPDGTLPDDQLNHDRRHLELRPTKDGAYTGEFRLTGTLGARLKTLLGPLAKIRPPVTGGDCAVLADTDRRTHGQRMHDAFEDLCDRALRAGDTPDTGGVPATVIVTITVDDLVDRLGYGRTADGTLIPTATVLQLADQADIIPTVLNAAGAVLSLGRTRRIATAAQSLALYARDSGCSFPGCGHPPQHCERHHVVGWIDGGLTDLNNLTLLCVYHHHNFWARGWTCRINTDGLPEWTPPAWMTRNPQPMINTRIQGGLIARQQLKRGRPINPKSG